MSGRFGLVYPLWNETLEPRDLLQRALDEVGLDHVVVPVVTGPVSEFRLAAPERPHRSFATEGGWHYAPTTEPYGELGMPPHVARWTRRRDHLADLCERLSGAGVAWHARIELRSVLDLFADHPQCRMRDAWGDEQPALGGCVVNPQLGALLRATLRDLLTHAPAGIELAGWRVDRGARTGGSPPFAHLPRAAQRLAETCFCAACRETAEQAGLDADAAAAAVRRGVFDLAARETPPDAPTGEEILAEYRRYRAAQQEAWLERLAETLGDASGWLLAPTGEEHVAATGWRTLVQCGHDAAEQLATCAPLVAADVRAVSLPVWLPAFESSAALVRSVQAAARAGIELFDFDDLAAAPPEALTWLKQAVRYGRRESRD